MPHITLKHDAVCADCGTALPAGTKARWFRNGDVYGSDCHRWQIGVGKRQQLALQKALGSLLQATKGKEIPDAARDRMAGLKEACGRQLTKETHKWLMNELAIIQKSICQP